MSDLRGPVRNRRLDPAAVRPLNASDTLRFHQAMPGYAASPLVELPEAAARLGVEQVWAKDESDRFGLPAFKILGAAWAVVRELGHRLDVATSDPAALSEVLAERRLDGMSVPTTLVAATDGNHGRAVARMARILGLAAVILVPHGTAAARIDAIASEGADVLIHDGDYDDTVRRAAAMASPTHLVIADTAWPGYEDVPAWVIEGYGTVISEALEQLAALGFPAPTVVAVQVGVGAFAAGVVRSLAGRGVRVIAVEPEASACLAPSLAAGRPTAAAGALNSIMAGLNCGEVSPIAWPDLQAGVEIALTVTDEDAREAMRIFARAGVTSGESGAAGLAGLLRHREILAPRDRVLVISSEGVTDPATYPAILAGEQVSA